MPDNRHCFGGDLARQSAIWVAIIRRGSHSPRWAGGRLRKHSTPRPSVESIDENGGGRSGPVSQRTDRTIASRADASCTNEIARQCSDGRSRLRNSRPLEGSFGDALRSAHIGGRGKPEPRHAASDIDDRALRRAPSFACPMLEGRHKRPVAPRFSCMRHHGETQLWPDEWRY